MSLQMSKWLHALHEGHEGGLAYYEDKPSWIVFTEEVGHDPNNFSTKDFSEWSNAGFWPVCRINNGYGSSGTIPTEDQYTNFARRVSNYISGSKGCMYWIIGNEPNLAGERPDGRTISPESYVQCFKLCRSAIKNLSGHRGDVVIPAPIAPYNVDTGDWLVYFETVMKLLESNSCDGIALHTYTHGSNPDLITSEAKMDVPYQTRYYNFRAYRDFLAVVPASMRSLPVLITETDQNDPWLNQSNHWIQNAYNEIKQWNETKDTQKIQCLALYRFPNYDKWFMTSKQNLLNDFVAAVHNGYVALQPKEFMRSSIPVSPPAKMQVTIGTVNVRKGPGTVYEIIDTKSGGDIVTVSATQQGNEGLSWSKIGSNQWVASNYLEPVVIEQPSPIQDDFLRNLQFVLKWEGGWADDPHDPGGATMKGITYNTYVNFLRKKSRIKRDSNGQEILPTKDDLQNISDTDLNEIYRGIWQSSGANKLSYPMNLAVFDLAVNGGDSRAKEFLAKCGQDFWCYMITRKNWYKRLPDFRYFGEAWLARTKDLVDTAYADS